MLSLSTEKLNAEQNRVLQSVRNGENLFYTGSAGTGTRYLITMFGNFHVYVTRTTCTCRNVPLCDDVTGIQKIITWQFQYNELKFKQNQ